VAGIWGKFLGAFRRPVSHVITPVLGIAAIATIIFGADSGGYSMATDIMAAAGIPPYATKGTYNAGALSNLPGHLVNGLAQAFPLLIGTAISGLVGRWLKV